MSIKHYYNTIKKGATNSKLAQAEYNQYCEEIREKVTISSRFIYVGNLDSPGIKELTEKILEESKRNEFASDKNIVLAIENAINPKTEEFISKLPENTSVIVMPQNNVVSIKEAAALYAYSTYGINSVLLNSLYKREAERLFDVLNCENIELLTSEKIERIEEIIACKKTTIWHKLPVMFYDRLSAMMYRKPSVLSGWSEKFDKTIEYDLDYGIEIWKQNRCNGIFLKMNHLKLASEETTTLMKGKISFRSQDKNAIVKDGIVLGSRIYDNTFRYDAEINQKKGKSCLNKKYDCKVEFPNKDMKKWFSTNVMYAPVQFCGEEIIVPVQTTKAINPFIKKVYDIKGTDYVCEIKDVYRHYRLVIRNKLVTDEFVEKVKMAGAYGLSLVTPWNKPVVLYEKKCCGYEESASALFEKLVDKKTDKVRYILNKEAKAALTIDNTYKKRIVEQFSFRHYYNLFASKSILSSEAIGHALEKGTNSKIFRNVIVDGHKDYVFLQHGVMYMVSLSAEQRNFFNKRSGRGKQKVVVSSQLEADHFTENTDYLPEDLYISGLPKFDKNSMNSDADKIAVMLTWRPWEEVVGQTDFRQTGYYNMLREIVESIPEKFRDKLIVMPHPLALEQVKDVSDDIVLKYFVPGLRYEEMLKQSVVLITDYSSISYDAFYRGANVIFCWAERDDCLKNYGENAHLMLTEDLAFGEVCYQNKEVGKILERVYRRPQNKQHIENYQKIVEFHDGHNTDRLIEMIERDEIVGKKKTRRKESIQEKLASNKNATKVSRRIYPNMLSLPIQKNAIFLEARNGKAVDGNIYYILKELLFNPAYKKYRIYLSVDNKKVLDELLEKLGNNCENLRSIRRRIHPVYVDSPKYFQAYATCKYLINDSTIKNFFIKRDGQVYLNVWHGTPWKYMGKKVAHEPHAIGNAQKNFAVADYLLYPNEYMMQHMVEDYMIENISTAKILLSGYPRNSVFLDAEGQEVIRKENGLENKRIYAYMPTWRPEIMGFSTEEILEKLDEKLKDDEILFAKIHPLAGDKIDYRRFKHIEKFPSNYETYEFLNVTDCLITDYSSVFYDYAVTGKKIILFTYDENEYLKTRGVYEPIDTLPFPRTETVEETLAEARGPKQYGDKAFINRFCGYESIDATDRLIRRVILNSRDVGIDERELQNNGLDIVMVEAGDMSPGERTEKAMQYFRTVDTSKHNYFLKFKRGEIENNKEVLFELPEGISYYGSAGKRYKNAEMEKRRVYGNISIAETVVIE